MRPSMVLSLLLLLAPTGQATLGLGLPLGAWQADQADAPAPSGPHLRVVLDNAEGARDVQVQVLDDEGHVHETRREALDDPEVAELLFEYPAQRFNVRVYAAEVQVPLGEGTSVGGYLGHGGDLATCEGAYVVGFFFRGRTRGGLPDSGCHAKPPGFDGLLAEAQASRPAGAPIRLPLPGGGDEGRYVTNAGRLGFRWTAEEVSPGSWGELRRGPSVTWASDETTSVTAGNTFGDLPLEALATTDAVEATHLPYTLRFDAGAATAWGHTAWSAPQAISSSSPAGTATQVALLEEFAYDSPKGGPGCLLRHALQGQEVIPGARYPAATICSVGSASGAWVAGASGQRQGFAALPLYFVGTDGAWTVVARLWLADGLPYPLEATVLAWAPERPSRVETYTLERLLGDGAPLAAHGPAVVLPAPPKVAPLHPLRGPSLAARERVAFPLEEAVDAALANPLLTDLHALVAQRDAVLAGGLLRLREREPATREHVWWLLFAAPRGEPVLVVCTRAALRDLLQAPAVDCASQDPSDAGAPLFRLPDPPTAAALPPRAASWDHALGWWGALDPARQGQVATYARYEPFGDEDPRASQGRLTLGLHFPVVDPKAPSTGPKEASYAVVELASARGLVAGRGTARATGLGEVPDVIAPRSPFRPSGGGALGTDAPLLAGAAVLGLAALAALLLAKGGFAALYTRLARPKLLDQDVRATIYALLRQHPGLHASELARHLGAGRGNTEYHLGVLVREGFLTTVATPGFRRYFVTGKSPPAEMRAFAAAQQRRGAEALRTIAARPGLTVGALAASLGVQSPAASKTIDALVAAGLVERRRDGRAVRLFPAPGAPPSLLRGPSPAEA